MRLSEEETASPDVRRDPDPVVGASAGATNEALNAYSEPSWMPVTDRSTRERNQNAQRTLQDLVLGTNSMPNSFSSGDISSAGYVTSENSTGADAGLSPDTAYSSSNRPTPNSTTPSESRSNLQPGTNSGGTSYETSPASTHQTRLPSGGSSIGGFFASHTDYSGIPSSGFTPENTFGLPETPGKDFPVPPEWEMSQQTTGLTPVGEGVFRTLMGLGMDPMDLGWEAGS